MDQASKKKPQLSNQEKLCIKIAKSGNWSELEMLSPSRKHYVLHSLFAHYMYFLFFFYFFFYYFHEDKNQAIWLVPDILARVISVFQIADTHQTSNTRD